MAEKAYEHATVIVTAVFRWDYDNASDRTDAYLEDWGEARTFETCRDVPKMMAMVVRRQTRRLKMARSAKGDSREIAMPVNIKPIKTDEDYQVALAEIDRLFDATPDTPEGDRLEVFVALVEAYERERFPMPPYDARELRGLMKEYIKTIDNLDGWEAEFFMTMRDYAEWQIEPFLDWLKAKED